MWKYKHPYVCYLFHRLGVSILIESDPVALFGRKIWPGQFFSSFHFIKFVFGHILHWQMQPSLHIAFITLVSQVIHSLNFISSNQLFGHNIDVPTSMKSCKAANRYLMPYWWLWDVCITTYPIPSVPMTSLSLTSNVNTAVLWPEKLCSIPIYHVEIGSK